MLELLVRALVLARLRHAAAGTRQLPDVEGEGPVDCGMLLGELIVVVAAGPSASWEIARSRA